MVDFKNKSQNYKKESFFFRSWWVFLVVFIGFLGYHQAMKKKDRELKEIEARLIELEKDEKVALSEKEDLLLRIQSQSDPAWIELVLMRELGVVPEGKMKVHFTTK